MWTSGRVRIGRLYTRHMWMADIGASKDLDGASKDLDGKPSKGKGGELGGTCWTSGWPWIERMVISPSTGHMQRYQVHGEDIRHRQMEEYGS